MLSEKKALIVDALNFNVIRISIVCYIYLKIRQNMANFTMYG